MKTRNLALILCAGSLLASSTLRADEPPKREVFGSLGYGYNYDDEGSIGRGISGGGGFGYRIWPRFGVEGEVNAFRSRREFAAPIPAFEANGLRLMGNGLIYLNRGPAQAYVLVGFGLLRLHNDVGFSGLRLDRSSNGVNAGTGVGVKVFVNRRWSIRPEFRVDAGATNGTIEAPFLSMRFQVGLGYHW